MNALDRLIGYFSPSRGAARAKARHALRTYEGAGAGRRSSSWRATGVSANSEIAAALKPLRDRARELGRNNAYAARILDIVPSHVVGNGIVPISASGKDGIDRLVNELWAEWQIQADVTGHLSFAAMQVLAVRSMIESGDVACRFIDREMEGARTVPMQLQLLEADFIDHFRDGLYGGSLVTEGLPSSVQRTRLGVAMGQYDEWQGLWLWPYHPGEMDTINQVALTSKFVPRQDLMHMFKVLRPGQVRGVSWFAPIMTNARDLADFLDAVNVKARVEACFAGFIVNDDSSQLPLVDPDAAGYGSDLSLPNASMTTLEPGMLKELRIGQDIKFAQPTSTTQVDPILMFNLQAIAAGVGCTYDQATGDLRQANYSSLRAGKLDFWRLVGQLQKHVVIPMLCRPTWDRFISRAILAGKLRPRRGGYPVDWVVPAKEMIDPKKDFDAAKNTVRAGAMTPQQFIASFGGDWRNDLEEFKAFFDRAHALGIVLDIDASRVDQHGRPPTQTADPRDQAAAEDQAQDDAADESDASDGSHAT
jgi:lambda family phage portal protein